MKKELLTTNNKNSNPNIKAFSLIEVLLSISIFSLVVASLIAGSIFGQQSTAISGSRSRAVILANEGIEAVRNIRNSGFSNIPTGTYGLSTLGNQWSFSGSSDTTDIFTRTIAISSIDANHKQVASTVNWSQSEQRNGVIVLTTRLTNWQNIVAPTSTPTPTTTLTPTPTPTTGPTCASYCISLGGFTTGTCRQNSQQCTNNSETYESGGDSACVNNFPGDASHDTCCCHP